MSQKQKQAAKLIIPPLLTVIILLAAYMIKGVYPFGSSDVSYYDMSQAYVPGFARLYEILNGNDSLIFNWTTGAGTDMTSSYPGTAFTVLNWFFFFLKPDYVQDFMAVLLMLKLVLTSVFFSYYLKKSYTLSLPIHLTLSMMYTFSGYVLQFYSNIQFFDILLLAPLLILALRELIKTGKPLAYLIILTYMLIIHQYLGFMVLIFVLLYSFGLMFTLREKEERKVFAARLGLYTFTSIALSAVCLFPTVLKWTTISRVSDYGADGLAELFTDPVCDFFDQKLFITFNTELAFVVMIAVIVAAKHNKKPLSREYLFRIYVFMFTLMPILNETTNLLLHYGSYVHFPYRVGFFFVFAAADLIACVWNDDKALPYVEPKRPAVRFSLVPVCVLLGAYGFWLLHNMGMTFMEYGIHYNVGSYSDAFTIFLLLSAVYAIILICFRNKRTKELVIFLLTTAQISMCAVYFIAPYEKNDEYINDSVMLKNSFELENDGVSRVKTLYSSLGRNYQIFLGAPSINQWLSEAVEPYFREISKLGYGIEYTSNYDFGGTLLSDALLNNKKLIVYGDVSVPEGLYTFIKREGDYSLYDINFTLPFGLITDESILTLDCGEDTTPAEHQKQLADAFTGKGKPLITLLPEELGVSEDNDSIVTYDIKTDSPCLLYIYSYSEDACEVFVNGEPVAFPYYYDTQDVTFPEFTESEIGIVGRYEAGEELSVRIERYKNKYKSQRLMLLDLDVMRELCEKYASSGASSYKAYKNSLSLTADTDGEGYMFLPLEYLEGWRAWVNGEEQRPIPVMNGAFTALKLSGGHSEITMSYLPPNLIKGAVISLIGLAAAAFLLIMRKLGRDIAETAVIRSAAYVLFSLLSIAVIFFGLILPTII